MQLVLIDITDVNKSSEEFSVIVKNTKQPSTTKSGNL